MTLSIVILAAGQGKRMHSQLPKILHPIGGKALLEHVAETTQKLNPTQSIVVFGHQGDVVRHALAHLNVEWVEQTQQLGTGHAVRETLTHIPDENRVLILYGDTPLISVETLQTLIRETPDNALGMITTQVAQPAGLGRIIRDNNHHIVRIIEEKDATPDERKITEINPGIYLVKAKHLKQWLPKLNNQNAQKEYYLTDIIAMAVSDQIPIHSIQPKHAEETSGINDRLQLAQLERFYQRQMAEKLLLQGITLRDPARLDIRGNVFIGQDVTIDVNVILEGNVKIGKNCLIGPNTVIKNTVIGDHVEIKANSVIDGAEIANDCIIGPFARLRPGTILSTGVHIGNFVEVKNSLIGATSKANHLSYIGDSDIGKKTNVGAGTITCNYDGINKHKTIIGDNVFIGSNSSLIAPVTLHDGATIGAGSTISRDAPANQLTLSRAQQRSIENWQRPMKKEKET